LTRGAPLGIEAVPLRNGQNLERKMKAAQHWPSPLAACFATALLLFSTAALPQAVAARQPAPAAAMKGAPSKTTHLLHLSAVQLEDSGWTDKSVLTVVRSAGRVLARCGVKLERVDLVSLAVPSSYLDLATPVSWALARAYRVARPSVYFVRSTSNSPAFEAEAIGRGNIKSQPELADTVWMTATREPGVRLAHELAHVLMGSSEHSEEPGNLMREEISVQNTALTPAQCVRLRDTATRNGLLKKAKSRT
jgi:hypothetical protein